MKTQYFVVLMSLLFSTVASAEVTFLCDRNPPLRSIEKAMITFTSWYNDPKAADELTHVDLYAKGDRVVDALTMRTERDEEGKLAKFVVSRATTPSPTFYEFAGLDGCNQEDPEYSPRLTIYTLDADGNQEIVKRSNCDCKITKN